MLVVFFQNCHPSARFSSLNDQQRLLRAGVIGGGNGDGYGGKLGLFSFYQGASDVKVDLASLLKQYHNLEGVSQFAVTTPLPSGLSLDSTTGVISGTPTETSNGYLTFNFTSLNSASQTVHFSIDLGVGYVYVVNPIVEGLGNPDNNLTDFICADKNGLCSLQAALDQAAANSVKSRIVVPTKTYVFTTKGIISSANFELLGQGIGKTELSGGDQQQVMSLSGKNVTLRNLSITHGKLADPEFGAGIKYFKPFGQLEIQNVELAFNDASATSMNGGGGIYFYGDRLIMADSHVHHNKGGGFSGSNIGGGGIYLASGFGTTIERTIIEDNSAPYGAGVYVYLANMTMFVHVTFARNIALDSGGGIWSGTGEPAIIRQSAFIGNRATISEGGAIVWSPATQGKLYIENTTFSQNQASQGGAISTDKFICQNSFYPVSLMNVTFAENLATTAGGGGALRMRDYCRLDLINTIITNNGPESCNLNGITDKANVTSLGYNIDSANSCLLGSGTGDLVNTDPQIAPLTSVNGNWLYPLLLGSPAIDSGSLNPALSIDQRGQARPQNGRGDRGSYEY